jgi:hypothetical protein|tara:strand:+ start:89 stop:1372 length:1284 start_codon:yes stop_codon:yes gene_type:complete
MFKSILKYFFIFLIAIAISYQFQSSIAQLRLFPKGIVKLIFPEKKIRPNIEKEATPSKIEIINANSFEVHYELVESFSGYNKDKDGNLHEQHKSAGFYASKENNKTNLELYTRNGFLITGEEIKQFELPNNYDSHNSKGGIRGIFYIDGERYAFMVTIKIGCQNVSIINLDKNVEIFDADCLPDYQQIHYDGIGGASVHNDENILLSIGAPTNSSELIRNLAQKDSSFYGKIISINKKDIKNFFNNNKKIEIKIFTKGHRNPQGLAKIEEKIFSAEHGPKGGDEVNILSQNNNYGWPIASYGTKYESIASASYKLNHLKNNFQEPLIQFTPSIAISDLTNCTKQMIDYYERNGCLIGTTLREQGLIIILLNQDFNRVIGYEKIEFGHRLRHLAKKKNGRLYFEDDGSIYVTSDSGEVFKVKFKLEKE